MQNVKVAVWGFGAMGSGIVSTLLKKDGVDIVGVCDTHPDRVGKSIFEVLDIPRVGHDDVVVTPDIDSIIQPGTCDICVIATDSFVERVYDKVLRVLKQKINVITLAEEMSYPKAQHPEMAASMDQVARENGVSVMGTGINPGLVMDLLAVCLTGAMTDVESVRCERVNSLSPFGQAVMVEQGVGFTTQDFDAGVADGSLTGHVGFAESVAMISDAIGMGVDSFRQQISSIVTNVDRKATYGAAKAGDVAGVNMTGQGLKDGKVVIDMLHPQQIEPGDEGVETGDYIELRGTPPINMAIQPEIDGGIGTIAMCVNCIPHVINADPGLISMIDIPVPRAIMDDFRNHVKPHKKIVG